VAQNVPTKFKLNFSAMNDYDLKKLYWHTVALKPLVHHLFLVDFVDTKKLQPTVLSSRYSLLTSTSIIRKSRKGRNRAPRQPKEFAEAQIIYWVWNLHYPKWYPPKCGVKIWDEIAETKSKLRANTMYTS
jgi:hypothetical protein